MIAPKYHGFATFSRPACDGLVTNWMTCHVLRAPLAKESKGAKPLAGQPFGGELFEIALETRLLVLTEFP